MHTIKSIRIEGLRGRETPLSLELDPHVNFLIGRNGSGKTTLINLINAAISGDVTALGTQEFSLIQIRLRRAGSNIRPVISVKKTAGESDDVCSIEYTIQRSTTSNGSRYRLSVDRTTSYGDEISPEYLNKAYRRGRESIHGHVYGLRNELQELLSSTWLSVHRAPATGRLESERFNFPVDKRFAQVTRDFTVFFSELDKSAASRTNDFQQTYFLSLVSPPRAEDLETRIGSIDVDQEYEAVKEIFSEFRLKPSQFTGKLENFRKRVRKAKADYKPKSPIGADDFLTLIDVIRVHSITDAWLVLLSERKDIFGPKTLFVKMINQFFHRKEIVVNSGNEVQFHDTLGKPLSPLALSSGEKQMFILLGETMLQRRKPYIFVADEPELSLHIDWQLSLVPSLRELNPNAQILFATHSPDIVGAYRSKAIDLESLS